MSVPVGVACEVAATALGTAGKQLISRSGKVPSAQRARLLKVIGLVVTSLFGPLLDALAYALAPQSLVAPLNALDIVWNTCSAPFTLGERLTRSHATGAALIFVGATLSSSLGPHLNDDKTLAHEIEVFTSWGFYIYAIMGILGLIFSAMVLKNRPRGVGDWTRGIALGATAGYVAGNMFFLSEALGMIRLAMVTGNWQDWQGHWLPYLVLASAVATAVASIPLMSKALQEYDALFIITLFAGCQIATACISAQVVLREMRHQGWDDTLAYWSCVALVMLGMVVVGRKARHLAPATQVAGDGGTNCKLLTLEGTEPGPKKFATSWGIDSNGNLDEGGQEANIPDGSSTCSSSDDSSVFISGDMARWSASRGPWYFQFALAVEKGEDAIGSA